MDNIGAGYLFFVYLIFTGYLSNSNAHRWHHSHFKVNHKMGRMKVNATPEGANFDFGGDELKIDMHPAHTWVRPIRKFYRADYHLDSPHTTHDDDKEYHSHGYQHDDSLNDDYHDYNHDDNLNDDHHGYHHEEGLNDDHHHSGEYHHYDHGENHGEDEGGYENVHHQHNPHALPLDGHRVKFGGNHMTNNYGNPDDGYYWGRGDVGHNNGHWGDRYNDDEEVGQYRDRVSGQKLTNRTLNDQKGKTDAKSSRDQTIITETSLNNGQKLSSSRLKIEKDTTEVGNSRDQTLTIVAEKSLNKLPEETVYGKHIYPDANADTPRKYIFSKMSKLAPDLNHIAEKADISSAYGSAQIPAVRNTISPFDDENDDWKETNDINTDKYKGQFDNKHWDDVNLHGYQEGHDHPDIDIHINNENGEQEHYAGKAGDHPPDMDAQIDNGKGDLHYKQKLDSQNHPPDMDVQIDNGNDDLHYKQKSDSHNHLPDMDVQIENDIDDLHYIQNSDSHNHPLQIDNDNHDLHLIQKSNSDNKYGDIINVDNGDKTRIGNQYRAYNNGFHSEDNEHEFNHEKGNWWRGGEHGRPHVENYGNATVIEDEGDEGNNGNYRRELDNTYRRSSQPNNDAELNNKDDAPLIVHPDGDPRLRQLKKAFFERNPSTQQNKHTALVQFSVRNRIPRNVRKRMTIRLPNLKKGATAKWNGVKLAFSKYLRTLKTVW